MIELPLIQNRAELTVTASAKQPPASRPILLGLRGEKMEALVAAFGAPRYRARQIERWLYRENVFDVQCMRDLPRDLRDHLAAESDVLPFVPIDERTSDRAMTQKVLLQLRDGNAIESVLMRYAATARGRARRTVCISSQAGCGIGCPFCATGLGGLKRNLTPAEIAGQVLFFADRVHALEGPDALITNVVLMGQGEPLANFAAVWEAIEILNDPEGFGLGARHVTVSTSGLVPRILQLAEKRQQVGLAVSLHAPTNELRDRLVPINRKYPLEELIPACRSYVQQTSRRISFEYAMMRGINDSLEQAESLAALIKGINWHVNLIPLNEVEGSPYRPTPWSQLLGFQRTVQRHGIACTVRSERGDPIDAACGQLRARQTLPLTPGV